MTAELVLGLVNAYDLIRAIVTTISKSMHYVDIWWYFVIEVLVCSIVFSYC